MAENDFLTAIALYATELSAASRTVLGLSSAAIGLLMALFRNADSGLVRWLMIAALGFFLLSIFTWLTFPSHAVQFRQASISVTMEGWGEPTRKKLAQAEADMLTAFKSQRLFFVIGVTLASVAIVIRSLTTRLP